jgi:DNA-directed RNA polymerase subunit RPC12/RpoP
MSPKEFSLALAKRWPTSSIELLEDAEKAVYGFTSEQRLALVDLVVANHNHKDDGRFFPRRSVIDRIAEDARIRPENSGSSTYFSCQSCSIILPAEPNAWSVGEGQTKRVYRCPRCGDPRHWAVLIKAGKLDFIKINKDAGYDGRPRFMSPSEMPMRDKKPENQELISA